MGPLRDNGARCWLQRSANAHVDHDWRRATGRGGVPRLSSNMERGRRRLASAANATREQRSRQWTTNGQSSNAPIAVWMRGDGRIVFTLRHDQLRVPNGFTGSRSYTVDGKQQPSAAITAETYEYRFQPIDDAPGNTISGSSTLSVPSSNAFAPVPQPGSTASAACSWQFVQSATPIAPPSTSSAAATGTTTTNVPTTLRSAGSPTTI